MFTWFQNTFHKHHKIMMGFLLFIMAASFVLYGFVDRNTGGPAISNDRGSRDVRDFFALQSLSSGRPLTPDDVHNIVADGRRREEINATQKAGEHVAPSREYQQYLTLRGELAAADAAGIPMPDDKALTEQLHTLFQRNGAFSPEALAEFLREAETRVKLDSPRVQNVFANLWRINKLHGVLTPAIGPDLDILAASEVAKNGASWSVETAVFPSSAYKLPAAPGDKEIAAHFEKNKADYRIEQKVRAVAIRLDGVPGAAPANVSESELFETFRLHFQELPDAMSVTRETLPKYLADNRAKLIALRVADQAGEAAAMKLSETLAKLFPAGAARPDAAKLAGALKAAGLKSETLPAFSAGAMPEKTGIPAPLLASALQLNDDTWHTGAASSGATAYAFVFVGAEPARDATLAEVRAKVAADLTASETRRLFAETAHTKALAIAAAVKAGKPFAEAAKAAGFTPEPVVTFVRRTPPEKLDGHMMFILDNLPVGAVSDAMRDANGMIVAHIVSRTPQAAKKDDTEIAGARSSLGIAAAEATRRSIESASDTIDVGQGGSR